MNTKYQFEDVTDILLCNLDVCKFYKKSCSSVKMTKGLYSMDILNFETV